MFGFPQFIQKMVTLGQKFQDAKTERIRLLNDNTRLLRIVTRLERDRDRAKADAVEVKGRLETAEDSLNQALAEMDNTKKAAHEDGYQKGFDAATASYVEQMPAIQDQIWVASWETCLTKAGVVEDSILWVENDLPSGRALVSVEQEEPPIDDVEQQIDGFADADEDIQMEAQDASTERSPIRETVNETINLEEQAASGGINMEATADVPSDIPPEVQNLD